MGLGRGKEFFRRYSEELMQHFSSLQAADEYHDRISHPESLGL
jgi:hypothetical protein